MFKLLKGLAIAISLLFFCNVALADNLQLLSASSFKPVLAMAEIGQIEYFPLQAIDEIEDFANNRADVIVKETNYLGYDSLQVTVSPEHESIDPALPIEEQGDACDSCTFLNIPSNQPFQNGTIEVDLASVVPENAPAWAKGFIGIVFRLDAQYLANGRIDAKNSTYESFYLRPVNSTLEDQLNRNHSVQYISIPGYPWYDLRRDSPGVYESYAPLKPGAWTKMRVEVEGSKARLYLNGSSEPALIVNDLKQGKEVRGTIGLYTEPETIAYFKDLKITRIP